MGNPFSREENKNENKENLETEEIPPDTKENNDNQDNSEEINSENKNQIHPSESKENKVEHLQQIGPVQRPEQNEEIPKENAVQEEQEEIQVQIQEGETGEESQQNQRIQEGQESLQGNTYQFRKDGQLFQVNPNGQLYKVIQMELNKEEDQQIETHEKIEKYNNEEEIHIAPPIYQEISQGQQLNNIGYQGYYPIYQEKIIKEYPKKMTVPKIKGFSNLTKKSEPRDSNPKMFLTSSRNREKCSSKENENINSARNLEENLEKLHKYEMNYTERGNSKSKLSKKVLLNKLNISSLKEADFYDIPRNEYVYYTDRPTLVIRDGMNAGKYKFIGPKKVLKEATYPRKDIINEDEIMQEILKRNTERKEKKVTYEIVDKFYTLTEISGKTIKRLERRPEGHNKTKFFKGIENRNYNKFNSKIKSSNISRNYKFGGSSNGSYNYYEFKTQIPIENKMKLMTNISSISSIASLPADNYSRYLLEQINRIRIDPQSFIGVIEDAKVNIAKDRFGRIIYKGKMKIALAKGESAFNEAIEYLKNIESMGVLKYNSYLTVMPPQNVEEIKDKDDLGRKINEMMNEGMLIKSYWRDVIKDPEISFLLMIVDDNGSKSGMRRRDILNPNMEYIGISSAEINRNFVCYITLS